MTHPSDARLRAAAAEIVAVTRKDQGLPPRISDPVVLGRLAAMLHPRYPSRTCSTRARR